MKSRFLKSINEIIELEEFSEKRITAILQELLNDTLTTISEEINQEPIINQRKITIGNVMEEFGVRYGIIRNTNEIIFGDWIFNLRKTTKSNVLIYIIIKESFMHFFNSPTNEVNETIINFISILWLQMHFGIKNKNNPIIITINRNIYPQSIAGKDHYFFSSLLDLLFRKKIDFALVFSKITEINNEINIKESKIVNLFSGWIYTNAINDEDVIAPIIINRNHILIIDYFVKHGYNSKISDIAKFLNKHENSIRHNIRQITSYYSASWQATINYEKLKLHNYFLKIRLESKSNIEQLKDVLLKIPYLKNIYTGVATDENILYSPSFISPHIVAESIEEQLLKIEKKKQIKDFTLQLISEKYRYTTISSSLSKIMIEPTIDTFKKLFKDDHSNIPLKKYIFLQQIRDNSPLINGLTTLDYNLLYFLSFLQQKYILGGRYGGWVHELPKFYEANNLSSINVEEIVNFLSQIEIRARRRGILSFSLYIRPPRRGSNVLIFETPLIESEKDSLEIINKIRIFPRLGQFTLHNRLVFVLPGISHKHPVKGMIQETLEKEGLELIFYTINLAKSRFVPLHDLFDYDEQKWKI